MSEALIARSEDRLCEAMRTSDLATLDELLADGLVFTSHWGALFGKQEDLAAHRDGVIKIDRLAASDRQIRMMAGVAIVTLRLEIAGSIGGAPSAGAFRFTRVWAPSADGAWQVIAGQATQLPEPPGG
ncbi:MAG: nuclear transport factor 2 family protein [Gemmatimonadales bacterium]